MSLMNGILIVTKVNCFKFEEIGSAFLEMLEWMKKFASTLIGEKEKVKQKEYFKEPLGS